MKELQILEQAMFDILEGLHMSLQYKHLDEYRLGLAVLDQLNDEYNELTGNFYVAPMRVLNYHSKQWSEFV